MGISYCTKQTNKQYNTTQHNTKQNKAKQKQKPPPIPGGSKYSSVKSINKLQLLQYFWDSPTDFFFFFFDIPTDFSSFWYCWFSLQVKTCTHFIKY